MKYKHHHLSKTKEYIAWQAIIQRCNNPNVKGYCNYGGRGITICDEWLVFRKFFKDMGAAPEKYSIERIDNSKGYYKENCKWATQYEQARNKRNNRWYTLNGETKILADWAIEIGIHPKTLDTRLKKMPLEKALQRKKILPRERSNSRLINFKGVEKNITEWAKELGIKSRSLCSRLQRGWSIERALSEKNCC